MASVTMQLWLYPGSREHRRSVAGSKWYCFVTGTFVCTSWPQLLRSVDLLRRHDALTVTPTLHSTAITSRNKLPSTCDVLLMSTADFWAPEKNDRKNSLCELHDQERIIRSVLYSVQFQHCRVFEGNVKLGRNIEVNTGAGRTRLFALLRPMIDKHHFSIVDVLLLHCGEALKLFSWVERSSAGDIWQFVVRSAASPMRHATSAVAGCWHCCCFANFHCLQTR